MKSDFETIVKGDAPVLLDFHATWCGPCQTLSPVLEEVKKEMGEKLKLIKIDIDKNQSLSVNFGIRSVPTMMVFKDGEEVWRKSGLLSKHDIMDTINKFTK